MLKNYFKVALRNLWKNKIFSAINIVGLAIGLATCLLILLYVHDELSYDRYNEKGDRIYRINSDIRFGGSDLKLAVSSDIMGETLKNDYPQVEEFVRIYASDGSKMIKKDNVFIEEDHVAHADSTIFDVFTLPMIAGDPKTALTMPNTVVISESSAKKYFGTTDVLGKTIETDEKENPLYKITAIIKDIPVTSHFTLDFIFPMANVDYGWGNFLSHNFQTYLLLKEGTDYREFEKNFSQVIEKYILPQAKQYMQISSIDEFEKAGNKLEYSLIPLRDIHLKSDRFPELGVNGNIQYVYIFSFVAFFILLLACINFMNLSTARSSSRAREVGIRKVLGTERKTLIQQFILESTLIAFISLLIALALARLALPLFNDVSGKSLSLSGLFSLQFLPLMIALPLIVGLLAGSYPAFFLSAFQPIQVLKGKLNTGVKRSGLRSTLVVFQFTTSIILIIGTLVVYRQLHFIQTQRLGFNKDHVLMIEGTYALGTNKDAFKNEVLGMNGVVSGTFSGYLPVSSSARNDNTFSKEAVLDSESGFNTQVWTIDEEYIPTLGMEMITGRNFSKDFPSDSAAIIINETTAKIIGYDNPLGEKLYTSAGNGSAENIGYTIIGVVKNFNFESLRQNIGPLCFVNGRSTWRASFRINTGNVEGLIKNIESEWKAMAPSMPFTYEFLDEAFDSMYRAEQRIGKIALAFAGLAILIACLGLLGLVTYMAEQRTKEIGIRKVLGATIAGIVSMISKDFLKLILIASVIAIPIAWYGMNKWLEDFAFRITLSWWVFLLAALGALLIAILTVSFQAVKAAIANPVRALRSE